MIDNLLRFLIGGVVVSVFAVVGDLVKPESLGGIFAAAPTIALATIPLTLHQHGSAYVATEARSMVAGAVAFAAYACVVSFVLMRWRPKALKAAGVSMVVWAVVSAGLYAVWLRK